MADAFFQAGGTVGAVNDFPYLDWDNDSGSWVEKESGVRNDGCDEFVAQQDKMVSQIAGNGGYYLDLSGNLRNLGSVPSRFSGRRFSYVNWNSKGSGFAVNSGTGEVVDGSRYKIRADGWKIGPGRTANDFYRAIYPSGTTWDVPPNTQNGRFGGNRSWHGISYNRNGSLLTRVARPDGGVRPGRYLPMDNGLCPAGFHPRGEDSIDRIGSHTGRTLTGLSHAVGKTADRYWCRSDLRFARAFETQNHGVPLHPDASGMSGAFQSYGRLNCYYTAFPITSHASGAEGIRSDSSGGMVCSYLFPIPQCDSNNDGTADSDYSRAELEKMRVGSAFTRGEGASCTTATTTSTTTTTTTTTTTAVPGSPTPTTLPPLPSFADDACVTVELEIYENRTKNSDAEPGIQVSHQTLTTLIAPAYDLDVTSPHLNTASPPRDTNDNSGCAYGPESRADHGTAISADRKNSVAADGTTSTSVTLPKSSAAANSQHPPHNQGFASAGTDYTGAVQNMAHRYASKVAENTCAAKRDEAELRLALLEAEAELYKDWMGRYERWFEGRKNEFGRWRPTGYRNTAPDTSPSSHATFYSFTHAVRSRSRLKYAGDMSAMCSARENAASAVVSTTLTKPVVGSSWCGNPSSFVRSYSGAVSSLKTASNRALAAGVWPNWNVNSHEYIATSPPRGTSTPTEGAAAVYETVEVERTRQVTEEYMDCSLAHLSMSEAEELPDDHSCRKREREVPETYSVNVLRLKTSEVKATVEYSYPRYTLTVSGEGWSGSKIIAATTSGPWTCSTWETRSCPSAGTHPDHSYSDLLGTLPGTTNFPSTTIPASLGLSVGTPALFLLLGEYHPQHTARTDLEHTAARNRDQAATNLGTLTIANAGTTTPTAFAGLAVPASNPATDSTETAQRNAITTVARTYQNTYTRAYGTAYSAALSDMGSTATTTTWNRFAWEYYVPSTLAWGNYQEDPAVTYSASAATPRDGTGCDLIAVASDGSVSVDATRLDYEGVPLGDPTAGSRYGVGSVFGTRTLAQRTCKIFRERAPELILEYQSVPPRDWGTDASKGSAFWHVDYQPTQGAERFKLYREAEVFAVEVSLADRAPVLCYEPGEALVAHVGAKGIDAVDKAAFRGTSGGNENHCYQYPSAAMLTPAGKTQPQPAFAFFDDTAHSAMESVSVVWQQPNPQIVSKLGSTDDLKMMEDTVNLVASSVAYVDAARTSSFYGTYYTFPTGSSVESPSGWDITGHPTLTLASIFEQHEVQAKDTSTATRPASRTLVFKFVDCVFGIEDVAFVDNIASPYALLSDENGVVPSGWKRAYDSDPHNSPTWYYPAFSTYEGALRLDGTSIAVVSFWGMGMERHW